MMKKYNKKITIIATIFTIALSGCQSSQKSIEKPIITPTLIENKCFVEEEEAPMWVCDKAISKGAYIAVCHLSADNNLPYTIGDARALARADIAEQLQADIYSKAVLTQNSKNDTSNTELEQTIISTSNVEFNENKNKYIEKIWISEKNEVFLRLELEK